jgi:hypothetical protein
MLYFKYRDCFITVQYHNENTEHKQIVPEGTASKTDEWTARLVIFPCWHIGASAGGLEAMELF